MNCSKKNNMLAIFFFACLIKAYFASVVTPHDHRGKVKPFPPKPPDLQLSATEIKNLENPLKPPDLQLSATW